jgi:hypothetical protein
MKKALEEVCTKLNIGNGIYRDNLQGDPIEDLCLCEIEEPLKITDLETLLVESEIFDRRYVRAANGIITEVLLHRSRDYPVNTKYQIAFIMGKDNEIHEVSARSVRFEILSPLEASTRVFSTYRDASKYLQEELHDMEIERVMK